MLLEHLCQLRTNVYSKLMLQPTISSSENSHNNNGNGNVKSEFPASKRQKTNNSKSMRLNIFLQRCNKSILYRKEHHQVADSSVISEQSLVLASPLLSGRGNGSVAPPPYQPASRLISPSVRLSNVFAC